jgi:DNA (cytosine-5)-methyltransferase 1
MGIADEPPGTDFSLNGKPRLTVRMVARLQGIADDWIVTGGKTAAYRQVGNAFPPPVAHAVGSAVRSALGRNSQRGGKSRPEQAALFEAAY